MSYTVGDVTKSMDTLFPPEAKEDWDRVGLITGNMAATCQRVLLAVDPCQATIDEAIAVSANVLITHHPLYLRGTHSVAETTAKGRWTASLIKNDIALFSAHTNADIFGSTAALAALLNITIDRPLDEKTGIGGVGRLATPMSLRDFAEQVRAVLPDVPAGVLIGGELDREIRTVAICSGAGDSFLATANEAGADVYLTADLRHHPATDHLWNGGCALISGTHWATEYPLLSVIKERLNEKLSELDIRISDTPTDPWALALRA